MKNKLKSLLASILNGISYLLAVVGVFGLGIYTDAGLFTPVVGAGLLALTVFVSVGMMFGSASIEASLNANVDVQKTIAPLAVQVKELSEKYEEGMRVIEARSAANRQIAESLLVIARDLSNYTDDDSHARLEKVLQQLVAQGVSVDTIDWHLRMPTKS